ncbi:MAG: hypothetical protein FWB88_11015 [Defluviitaleaceae bacterium]|nr:hypothetical protein [Defluviitaleaceae bacterium]MCL2240631.1 hypothetical protein [Defluviitaleaceae bacterium]
MLEHPLEIRDVRCIHDSDCVRLVFPWPEEVAYVYITRAGADEAQERVLLTIQEYKRRGGYAQPKTPGIFTFRIYRDVQGEPVGTITCQTGHTTIYGTLKRKWGVGAFVTHALTLASDYPVEANVLGYAKSSDGVIYLFSEPLTREPLTRHILTARHEKIILHIADEKIRDQYIINVS